MVAHHYGYCNHMSNVHRLQRVSGVHVPILAVQELRTLCKLPQLSWASRGLKRGVALASDDLERACGPQLSFDFTLSLLSNRHLFLWFIPDLTKLSWESKTQRGNHRNNEQSLLRPRLEGRRHSLSTKSNLLRLTLASWCSSSRTLLQLENRNRPIRCTLSHIHL